MRYASCVVAERERFELSRPLRAYGISSAAPSTGLGDRSAGQSTYDLWSVWAAHYEGVCESDEQAVLNHTGCCLQCVSESRRVFDAAFDDEIED